MPTAACGTRSPLTERPETTAELPPPVTGRDGRRLECPRAGPSRPDPGGSGPGGLAGRLRAGPDESWTRDDSWPSD